ncbi:glycogen debranching enzyme GlgX [Mangrovactinospora gilvigrisea]|uniref:Glycogen debranching enzyme GlgX n=1 Tax=Mangrovactinospora gilvigrisea TaxID=1428644 RepID=A0A1J7C2W2_9ACTN|nr:glycogen debranching protein GlgX [Mangrovactinospora gilvigrisea]OIV35904.1 glycogen debranching enzyme GlgX [Mangrovactinospora gilvigrisea]
MTTGRDGKAEPAVAAAVVEETRTAPTPRLHAVPPAPVPRREVWPGDPADLGARCRPGPDGAPGVNFALWAPRAEGVELCLFRREGGRERELRLPLRERTGQVWHGFVPGLGAGTRYGYRVHGRWDPWTGDRFNPAKLLLDPYARALDGAYRPHPATHAHVRDWPEPAVADTVRDNRDSAPYVPRSVVVADLAEQAAPDGLLRRPGTPWRDTVLYEMHVKGFTRLHPDVPEELRGSYAGLAHPAAVEELRRIGVTAVELLPVHHHIDDGLLADRGLTNYWGYSSIGFFAPHPGYASDPSDPLGAVAEFRQMVAALHDAGIEVILDVVYNHTGEGGTGGPALSFRGIDNAGYYRLDASDPRRTVDTTGCGNMLDASRPQVLRLIADSLRHWVTEMGVDGFRFDLATALARAPHEVDPRAPFLGALAQDPVLSRVKLIAEPWDIGPGGYQVGAFPPPWAEWNDRFRDGVRDFWRGAHGSLRELGYRLSGSSDLFELSGRQPWSSVNFVTAHDGFTLRDLVSYDRKHNAANGEEGRDGTDDNRSWNCGAEGEVEGDADIDAGDGAGDGVRSLRRRQQRNLLATLLLSAGTPMLVAGDERGRTQGGNNNAYCQDNAVSWMDWADGDGELAAFTARLIALRRSPGARALRRDGFFTGRVGDGGLPDVVWLRPDGRAMGEGDWFRAASTLGVLWSGRDIGERDAFGAAVAGDTLLGVFHAGGGEVEFTLPGFAEWEVLVDTAERVEGWRGSGTLGVHGRSVLLLRAVQGPPPHRPGTLPAQE